MQTLAQKLQGARHDHDQRSWSLPWPGRESMQNTHGCETCNVPKAGSDEPSRGGHQCTGVATHRGST